MTRPIRQPVQAAHDRVEVCVQALQTVPMLRLASETDPAWVTLALAQFHAILVDHAHCEHKAAVTALSFVSKYPDDTELVLALSALARDEADHLARVAQLCFARGLDLGHPGKDPYAQALLALVRTERHAHRIDRLLVCALIEGRSCERLKLLSHALNDGDRPDRADARALYDALWREEASHHMLFVDLAVRSAQRAGVLQPAAAVEARLQELATAEAAILAAQPLRPAIH